MSFTSSRVLISFIYILLLTAGAYLIEFLPEPHLLIKLLIIDIILTIIIFSQSVILKNASVYDLYWSIIPFAMLFYWIYVLDVESFNYRMMIAISLLSVWSWRLSINWFRGWKGVSHEDWRYENLRVKTDGFFPIVSFLGIHLFPTLLVFGAALPLKAIFASESAITYVDAIGASVMGLGILIEGIADNQMHRYKNNDSNQGIISEGIWRFTRHPNYLGEILFWWGLYILAIDAGVNPYFIIGPILITLLFIFISIPMMEKRLDEKYSDYKEYKRTTSMLVPLKFLLK